MSKYQNLIRKLTAALSIQTALANNAKCDGVTGKIGNITLKAPPINISATDWATLSDAEKARADEKNIKTYYGKLLKAVKNCSSTDECSSKGTFEGCFQSEHAKVIEDMKKMTASTEVSEEGTAIAAVDPMIGLNPNLEPEPGYSGPPTQMGPTERRNCILRKNRCLCEFYIAKAKHEILSAQEAELYNKGVEKYYINPSIPVSRRDAEKAKMKQKFSEACKKISEKSGYLGDSPCKKKPDGKFMYSDCKDFCEKCSQGEPDAGSIEVQEF
jgi:hypothetical protein